MLSYENHTSMAHLPYTPETMGGLFTSGHGDLVKLGDIADDSDDMNRPARQPPLSSRTP